MSELSSCLPGASRLILSASDLAVVKRQVRQSPGGSRGPAIEFELGPDGPLFGVVPLRAFPAAWSSWSLSPQATGLGLCLPVEGAGHLCVALNRSGDATWFSIDRKGRTGEPPPACQLLDDVCRVRLGMPTAPPDRHPDWYWLGQWLSGVVDVSMETPQGEASSLVDVITVATAHPAIAWDELADLDMDGLAGFVVDRHRDHVQVADWECIHLDASTDVGHPFHDLAEVMDAGAFSRWVSAGSPPLSDLAATLTARCTPLGLRLLGAVISDMVLRQRIDP